MKKVLAILLAALMLLPVFATAEGTDITSWILEEDTSISGDISFWMPFKGSQGMDALIADFNKTYPNIKVTLNTYNNNSDGNLSVNTSIMAGEVDVLASFGLSSVYKRWESGLYEDLTDLVEEEGIDLVANWGSDAFQLDETIYTFPCGGLSYYVAINMSAWEKAGLGELPTEWTWDEYLAASKAMTEYNDDGTVKVYGGSDYHSQNYFTYQYGAKVGKNAYYDADGTSSFDNPAIIKALEREVQAELVDKIWFPKATYRGDNLQAQQTFLVERVVNSAINPNMVRFLPDTTNYGVDFITGFAPWPVDEKGQTNYMSGVSPFSHAGIAFDAERTEEEFAACWAFLKWYSTYGVKYLAAAGHQPNWAGTEPGSALALLFGSEDEAAKFVDVESFKRVVGVATSPQYYEDELTAYSTVNSTLVEYTMYALNGTMTAEEAMLEAAKIADEAIAKER